VEAKGKQSTDGIRCSKEKTVTKLDSLGKL